MSMKPAAAPVLSSPCSLFWPPRPRSRRRAAPAPAPGARAGAGARAAARPPAPSACRRRRPRRCGARRRGPGRDGRPPSTPSRRAGPADPDSFLPTLMGPIGLYHISTAEVGPGESPAARPALRLLQERRASSSRGDENSRVDGSFSFGYTPHEYVELFGAMLTSSNRNERSAIGEPPRRDPELIKSFGDLVLGAKTALPVARGHDPRLRARLPLPVVDLRPVGLAELDVALVRAALHARPAAHQRHAAALPRLRQLLRRQLEQPHRLLRSDDLDLHARGGLVRLRHRQEPLALRPRRRRAARAAHGARAARPLRRVPRRDRDGERRPGVQASFTTRRTATSSG